MQTPFAFGNWSPASLPLLTFAILGGPGATAATGGAFPAWILANWNHRSFMGL